jgi:hypothetical protein
LPPQVSNNDFKHLGYLSKCASQVEQHLGVVEMDKGVKESHVHFNPLILILDEVDLLLQKKLTLTCLGGC